MPTEKQRVSVVLSDEIYKQLEEYRFNNRIPSLSKAVSRLIELGLLCKVEPSLTEASEDITVTFDKPLLREILNYQNSNNVDSFSRAVRMLVHFGFLGEEVEHGDLIKPEPHAFKRNEWLLLAEYLAGANTTDKQEFILRLVRGFRHLDYQEPSVELNFRQKEIIDQMQENESTFESEA